MEKRPHALLLKFPGTNCDTETARALEAAGFSSETVPVTLIGTADLERADLVVLSGGFSYGDYVMAGRLAQLEIQQRLGDALAQFRDRGNHILGICNGFQILTQLKLLPEGSLIDNTSGRFQCRWVTLQNNRPDCAFLSGLPETFELPIAHAEGRFVTTGHAAEGYLSDGLAALTYDRDVNGAACRIAGVIDTSGRVLGLMPHPERFLYRHHHYDPDWKGEGEWGFGYHIFRSLHDHIVSGSPVPA